MLIYCIKYYKNLPFFNSNIAHVSIYLSKICATRTHTSEYADRLRFRVRSRPWKLCQTSNNRPLTARENSPPHREIKDFRLVQWYESP